VYASEKHTNATPIKCRHHKLHQILTTPRYRTAELRSHVSHHMPTHLWCQL